MDENELDINHKKNEMKWNEKNIVNLCMYNWYGKQ